MFTEITDIDKAWELYQAGLLWECMRHKRVADDGYKAYGWYGAEHLRNARPSWCFFILTEE